MRKGILAAVAVLTLLPALAAEARIKLVALPEQDFSLVRLDNPAFSVVEEERTLTLQKGPNEVDFSWKGVNIDQDSIRLSILGHPDKVSLISVSYPPNEAALTWQVFSPDAYNEKVRISYLLSNIDRVVTYEGLASKDESSIDLKSYLVLRNFSGEDFANTKVMLDYGESFDKSIRNQETKRMLFFTADKVLNQKTWTWDDQKQQWDPERVSTNVGIPVYYTLKNVKETGLGANALWGGKVRVQQDDGHQSTIFLGEDTANLVPIGEEMKIYVGDSRDIVVTQRKMKEERITMQRNRSGAPVLTDTNEVIETKVENFKDKPAVLILTEHIPGDWTMKECSQKFDLKDFQTLEFRFDLKAKEKTTLTMNYQRRNLR